MIYRIYKPDGSYKDYTKIPSVTENGCSLEILSGIDGKVVVKKLELRVINDK